MDYIIREKDIYSVEIVMYDDIIHDKLILRKLPSTIKYRKAVYVNNVLLDFETGDEILFLNVEGEYVVGPIYQDRMYVLDMAVTPYATYNDLLHAANIYQKYKSKNELIKERKIIPFPNKRIK